MERGRDAPGVGPGDGRGAPLTGHQASVHGALALADGRVLSWSADGTLRVWDLATGEGARFTGHEDAVDGALVLADGRVLSWSVDGTLRVWDLATGEGRPLHRPREWRRRCADAARRAGAVVEPLTAPAGLGSGDGRGPRRSLATFQ